jgi:outer membrane protein OmpA-like peptidoglycan-associated protein
MKIAIGDVGDPQYDSGVFLEEGSFTSKKDPTQTKFKEYPDLSMKVNFDSIFGSNPVVTQATKDSIAKEEADYERFNITNINFEFDSYEIPDTSKDELQFLSQYLKKHNNFRCDLYGYTDNKGSKKYNQRLSESRANAVMSMLVAKGVPSDRLAIAGYNFENPIADNREERGRAKNRRVEIVLIED